jgi:hypothetical protein
VPIVALLLLYARAATLSIKISLLVPFSPLYSTHSEMKKSNDFPHERT